MEDTKARYELIGSKPWEVVDSQHATGRIQAVFYRGREDAQAYHGTASCGLQTMFWIPGIFSRMGAPRCKRCCRATGLPQGKGSPKNDPECRKLLGLDSAEVAHNLDQTVQPGGATLD